MSVDNDHKYEQVRDYLQTIDWDKEIGISPQNYKQISDYYDWIDWETEE